MKKVVADKWVKALRSGKYKQCGGTLQYRDDSFCCLGVLCDLAEKEGVDVERLDGRVRGDSLDRQPGVQTWAGLKSDVGSFSTVIGKKLTLKTTLGRPIDSLADLNDYAAGWDFNKIATFISKHWRSL